MKETSCEVIRDLLPLYEDNAVSEETAKLVREHLADCPDCREELRKMRTPISLPPDGDEEAVRRYLERRAEIRKKQNVKIAWFLAVAGSIALFCLWYVWPRSWKTVTGSMPGEVTSLSAYLTFFTLDISGTNVRPGFDTWSLGPQEIDASTKEAIMNILDRSSFRKSLKNLIPGYSEGLGGTEHQLQGYVNLMAIWDEDHHVYFALGDNGHVLWDGRLYFADQELYSQLAEIIQKQGTFQKN